LFRSLDLYELSYVRLAFKLKLAVYLYRSACF
jgi:hypothetical protein